MIDLINMTTDYLLILSTGVASGNFVNLLTVTYKYQNSSTTLGNGPRMSSPYMANSHEDMIICSVYAGVWICLA
jgi:hypothetical protein